MKTLFTLLSASAILTTFVYAESASSVAVQAVHQEQNEIQNRIRTMATDELLEKRGTMTSQQEREQLHNELMNRQQTMTKEQKEKFKKRPENRTPKMKNQGDGRGKMQGNQKGKNSPEKVSQEWGTQDQGNAYGQGQGMMQGQDKKGGGKGGR